MFLLPSILWVAFSLCWLHPLIHRSFKLWYCRGSASAESRDILRMDDVGEWRKIEKEIRKEWHGVTKLQWARPVYFIFLGAFIPWVIYTARWKMQSQLNIPSVTTLIDIRLLPVRVLFSVNHLLFRRPVEIPWPLLDKCWSVRTIIFP